jgi:hypothetical protein
MYVLRIEDFLYLFSRYEVFFRNKVIFYIIPKLPTIILQKFGLLILGELWQISVHCIDEIGQGDPSGRLTANAMGRDRYP